MADVDGDQKDEIVFGSMTIDDDGTVLYSTGLGHGDALHVSDLDPDRDGLEVFAVHEEAPRSKGIGATFRDAATGEVLWSMPATADTGRGASGDIDASHPGAESWAVVSDGVVELAGRRAAGRRRLAAGHHHPRGELPHLVGRRPPAGDHRPRLGHDGAHGRPDDLEVVRQTDQSATEIYRATGTLSDNGTKGTPALQADLFGDWREEIVTRLADSSALRIATTVDLTDHRLRTLQSDPVYRLGVAWQNTGYNQPPHTSYFLGDGMATPAAPSIVYTGAATGPDERVPGPATAKPAEGACCPATTGTTTAPTRSP